MTAGEDDVRQVVEFFNDAPHLPEPRWNGWFVLALLGGDVDWSIGPFFTEARAAEYVRVGEHRVYDDATCCTGCA